MRVRVLGAHNSESAHTRLVSLLVDGVLALDAGSLTSEMSFAEQERIEAILLTHGHYDHIRAVPAFAFGNTDRITGVYGTAETLDMLSSHLLDGIIYPRFTEAGPFPQQPTLKLCRLELLRPEAVSGYRVRALPVNHKVGAAGLEVTSADGTCLFYTGDTGPNPPSLWTQTRPQVLVIETTFPNEMAGKAREVGHLCPEMLREELVHFRQAQGYVPRVVMVHVSPQFENEIREQAALISEELGSPVSVGHEGDELAI